MTRVNSGVKFEYRVRDYLQAKGYEIIRAAGSKGAVDLVASKEDDIIFIQAKKESRKLNYSEDEKRLREVPAPGFVRKQLWIKHGTDITVVQLEQDGNKLQMMQRKDMTEVIRGDD